MSLHRGSRGLSPKPSNLRAFSNRMYHPRPNDARARSWVASFSFGNGCQATDIIRSHFQLFSKCTLKSLNNQADFDSAVWLPSLRRGPLLKRPTSKSTPSSACKEVQQNVQQGVQHENEAADLSVCCNNEKSNKDFRAERFTRSNQRFPAHSCRFPPPLAEGRICLRAVARHRRTGRLARPTVAPLRGRRAPGRDDLDDHSGRLLAPARDG